MRQTHYYTGMSSAEVFRLTHCAIRILCTFATALDQIRPHVNANSAVNPLTDEIYHNQTTYKLQP
jgi:hypothetical protein